MTGGQRLWWRSWRWRCWVTGREKHSTPGCGCLATDGVVRRRGHTWPSAVDAGISGLDVVDGSVRIYVRSMVGGPGRGLSSATTRTRCWSPWSAWHRHGAWACCVGGAGRDLQHVGVRGGESVGAEPRNVHYAEIDCMIKSMLRAASSSVASWRSARPRPVPQGLGRADGRGVVMGCDGPLACGGGAVERVGAVWFGAHRVCRRAFRDGQVCCGWGGGLAALSRGCHKRRGTWWDGGRCAETISAAQREGRDGLERVNTASR